MIRFISIILLAAGLLLHAELIDSQRFREAETGIGGWSGVDGLTVTVSKDGNPGRCVILILSCKEDLWENWSSITRQR